MLRSLIYDNKGQAYLNSLRRFAFSANLVPSQENLIVNVPAMVGLNAGHSMPIPIQGPEDAKAELYSMIGFQGVVNLGIGVITTVGGVAVVGTGTNFTSQLQVGSTIAVAGGNSTVATITDATHLTTVAPLPVVAGVQFFFTVAVVADVRDRMTCEIEDQAWRRRLMNRDVPVQHVFGTAQKPKFLAESLLLETDQTLLLRFINNSAGGPGSLAPLIEARKWQVEALKRNEVAAFIEGLRQRKKWVQPYWLTCDDVPATLAAGASGIHFFTVTGDVTVILFELMAYTITAGRVGDTQEVVSLEFYDAKTERALQVQPTTINTACGTSSDPFVLPTPLVCEPNSQIKCRMRNLITSASTDVFMTFHGVAVYTGYGNKGGALTEADVGREARRMYANIEPSVIPASAQG